MILQQRIKKGSKYFHDNLKTKANTTETNQEQMQPLPERNDQVSNKETI